MRVLQTAGNPPGIARAPEVPLAARRAGVDVVVLARGSVRRHSLPIADSGRRGLS
jgi:hypothetical protein